MSEFNPNTALLTIYSGAGGVDAQDWASMLLRMYRLFAQKKGWKVKLLSQSFGEQGGTKEATLEIKGKNIYPLFKNEAGVHRLVRMSPYSAKKLRHTSFALVEVVPEVTEAKIAIKPQELKIKTYRASGPGGQYVNKRDTAVRITHLPTGLTAACQEERSQAANRQKALQLLQSKLYSLLQKEQHSKIEALKQKVKPEWGNQIRSYILHPYQMVKDHRTGKKFANVESVLEGNLEKLLS